jgi:DNA (cytosine-5)-methyltransferase 1
MRLLDLFCGAGGCSVGYHRAGFTEIVGVDLVPQSRYPFRFVQADALEYLSHVRLGAFDAVVASPPCQAYSAARSLNPGRSYPGLLGPTRDALIRLGAPWVIENVEGSPMGPPYGVHEAVMLCGTMFALKTLRHRLFEASFPLVPFPLHPKHPLVRTHDRRKKHGGRKDIDFVAVYGGNVSGSEGAAAMGIDWMVGRGEVSQAIPPAYTEYVGRQLVAHIAQRDVCR